jgi:F-type H+-transporting ATPase subunit a
MAHEHDPLDHVLDDKKWVFFDSLFGDPVEINLPAINIPLYGEFQITKFMLLELIACAVILAIFIPVARRIATGKPPKGIWWNLWESMITFVRDNIARPNLNEDTDKYMPMLWTAFFLILFCNILGLIPLFGSPTASIFMTAGLAIFSLLAFHFGAIFKLGGWGYVKSYWPPVEIVPYPLRKPGSGGHGHDDHGHGDHGHDSHGHHEPEAPAGPPPEGIKLVLAMGLWLVSFLFCTGVSLMIFLIEFGSTFIKSGVLALRLFVNMFAGHVVIASILLMIVTAGTLDNGDIHLGGSFWVTSVISVLAVTALSLLELFVAFLQAFVFTFLTALFLGLALHPSH